MKLLQEGRGTPLGVVFSTYGVKFLSCCIQGKQQTTNNDSSYHIPLFYNVPFLKYDAKLQNFSGFLQLILKKPKTNNKIAKEKQISIIKTKIFRILEWKTGLQPPGEGSQSHRDTAVSPLLQDNGGSVAVQQSSRCLTTVPCLQRN
jgi:hypothetical protein